MDLAVAFTIVVSILGSSTVTYLASSRTISGVAQESKRTIREITNDFLHKFIAGGLQRVASRENRKLDSSDLSNGLDFANKALRKFEGGE